MTSQTELIQRVLDTDKFVYVVFAVRSDYSASKILGIYRDPYAAQDRVNIANAAESTYYVTFAKCPLDKAFPVELRA